MDKVKYRLKGHESFILREGWLTKGMMAVEEDAKVFSKNSGADALGVGTNMAKSIRYWLKTAGLIEESPVTGARLSDIGKLIYENDPYFENIFSLWVVHLNISRNFAAASSWNVFFNDISVNTFKRDELVDMQTTKLLERTLEDSLPERSVKDDCYAILNMYAKSHEIENDPEEKNTSPFSELGLLDFHNGEYEKTRPSLDGISPYLILYLIEDELVKRGSIRIDDLSEQNDMPGKLMNLNRIMLNEYLDFLNDHGFIIVNRTAGLDMIYPAEEISTIEILKNYYEEVAE